MANDIKSLLDNIIDDTDKSFPTTDANIGDTVGNKPLTFDRGGFREKLSLCVLKDMISAMMDDHTEDMDGMIDNAIVKHIANDYNGSCYDYLCKARDRRKSPLLGDVIQEIDNAVEDADETLQRTKDPESINDMIDVNELSKNVENYKDFREKLRDKVSKKIIMSVTAELVGNDDAPKFKKTLDAELKAVKPDQPTGEPKEDDAIGTPDLSIGAEDMMVPKQESVIVTAATKIISESYFNKTERPSIDVAMNQAICEYCLTQLDLCFTMNSTDDFFDKYIYSR
jgi:hypothetical protein